MLQLIQTEKPYSIPIYIWRGREEGNWLRKGENRDRYRVKRIFIQRSEYHHTAIAKVKVKIVKSCFERLDNLYKIAKQTQCQ